MRNWWRFISPCKSVGNTNDGEQLEGGSGGGVVRDGGRQKLGDIAAKSTSNPKIIITKYKQNKNKIEIKLK